LSRALIRSWLARVRSAASAAMLAGSSAFLATSPRLAVISSTAEATLRSVWVMR
jgi:hypothetical protein